VHLASGARAARCHHCGAEAAAAEPVPALRLRAAPVGQGTERVEETLAEFFPAVPIARSTATSCARGRSSTLWSGASRAARRGSWWARRWSPRATTFPNVTLVVVLNADQGLFSTDFRAAERLAQTIVQVAGRAGRATAPARC
jgi:primosomal protein N' (replication factor Y)